MPTPPWPPCAGAACSATDDLSTCCVDKAKCETLTCPAATHVAKSDTSLGCAGAACAIKLKQYACNGPDIPPECEARTLALQRTRLAGTGVAPGTANPACFRPESGGPPPGAGRRNRARWRPSCCAGFDAAFGFASCTRSHPSLPCRSAHDKLWPRGLSPRPPSLLMKFSLMLL